MIPKLVYSPITHEVHIVTELGYTKQNGERDPPVQYNVTEAFNAIVKAIADDDIEDELTEQEE